MKVPFTLEWQPAAPATAVLLLEPTTPEGESPDKPSPELGLLRLCARLSIWPMIHSVSEGFLVRLPPSVKECLPGGIRLRALADNLFVPVDARLVPELWPDEANALTRQRGLVFLPGEVVLAFDPERRLAPADLLSLNLLPEEGWHPLPPRPVRPDELSEIARPVEPEALLANLGEAIGTNPEPLPRAGGPGAALSWLGGMLGWSGLTHLGERLAQSSNSIRRAQEQALQRLLEQFRRGDIEGALQRAIPLGGPGGRGGTASNGQELPTQDLTYRSGEFVGSATSGLAGLWSARSDLFDNLEREYRRQALEAMQRGDYRRAAVIYGRLLRDWSQAALMLSRAGLHHDAALVHLHHRNDPRSAAISFEAAGEMEEALRLYRQQGEHVLAGELLQRMGDAEGALGEFIKAAEQEARQGNFLKAANLLRQRTDRIDLVVDCFERGLEAWPAGESLPCLIELMEYHADRADPEPLAKLLHRADRLCQLPGMTHEASRFYNTLARTANRLGDNPLAEDLRDRALLGVARLLRQRDEAGESRAGRAARILHPMGGWESGQIHDAEVALATLKSNPAPGQDRRRRLSLHEGIVTSAVSARQSGDLFLGFEDGFVVHFDPVTGSITRKRDYPGRVISLSCNEEGTFVAILRQHATNHESHSLSSWKPRSQSGERQFDTWPVRSSWLTSMVGRGTGGILGRWMEKELDYLSGPDLFLVARRTFEPDAVDAVILDGSSSERAQNSTVRLTPATIYGPGALAENGEPIQGALPLPGVFRLLCWYPAAAEKLQIALVPTRSTRVIWLDVGFGAGQGPQLCNEATLDPGVAVRAMTFVGPERLKMVHAHGVRWLRVNGRKIETLINIELDLEDAYQCHASPRTGELLIVTQSGEIVRVGLS